MAQQPEAGDVRAGMDVVPVGLKLVQQLVLTAGQHRQHRINRRRSRRTGHRSGEQHTCPQRTAQQQRIPRSNASLPPGLSVAAPIDAEGQLQSQFCRLGRVAAGFQCVASDQGCPLLLQHGAHPFQRLRQQLLLIPGLQDRQCHDSLGTLHG